VTAVDLTVPIPDALIDAIAERVGDKLTEHQPVNAGTTTPWLSVEQAAEYIGNAPTSRVYDLVQRGALKPHRDGRRLLFKRSDLDDYIEASS
jgi:excisionase family DNA binding protein